MNTRRIGVSPGDLGITNLAERIWQENLSAKLAKLACQFMRLYLGI